MLVFDQEPVLSEFLVIAMSRRWRSACLRVWFMAGLLSFAALCVALELWEVQTTHENSPLSTPPAWQCGRAMPLTDSMIWPLWLTFLLHKCEQQKHLCFALHWWLNNAWTCLLLLISLILLTFFSKMGPARSFAGGDVGMGEPESVYEDRVVSLDTLWSAEAADFYTTLWPNLGHILGLSKTKVFVFSPCSSSLPSSNAFTG